MLKVISFDLDGTLVKNKFADSVWLKGFPKLYAKKKKISEIEAKKFLYSEYEKVGKENKEWYDIDWWFKRFKINEDWINLLKSYSHIIGLYPETNKILNNLYRKFKLIIISNAKKEFIDIQIEKTNIINYFECVFSSLSDFNSVKKYPDVYRNVCKKIRIEPSEIIHIGDNKEFDYISPSKIGIQSYYLDREKSEKGDNIIYTLDEILDKI